MTTNFVTINIPDHGTFACYLDVATVYCRHVSKVKMIDRIMGIWPDVFTRAELRKHDKFTLAVILHQVS